MSEEMRVEKYKGDKKLQKGLNKMQADGWIVQNQSTRKSWWSWKTGLFTRKQIHTVTYAKNTVPPMPES